MVCFQVGLPNRTRDVICGWDQATATDLSHQNPSPRQAHVFWKEKAIITFLAAIVYAGFTANIVLYLNPHKHDKLSAFTADSSSATLRSLVAILASRSGISSQEEQLLN